MSIRNYALAVPLLNSACILIACSYQPDPNNAAATVDNPNHPPATELFKTFRTDLKKGDLVVVKTNTRHGFTIVRVERTKVPLDLNIAGDIPWVTDVFDPASYQNLLRLESQAIEKLKENEAKKQAEQIRKDMGLDDPSLQELDIAKPTVMAALAAPAAE